MAFDENLARRIRNALARKKNIEEKKMFGDVGILLNGNLLVGVWKDSMIAGLDSDNYKAALRKKRSPQAQGQKLVRFVPAKL